MVALTIKVRVFKGDTEQDVMCKFNEPPLHPKHVIAYICDKIDVPVEYRFKKQFFNPTGLNLVCG
jgi:hypothetical protein